MISGWARDPDFARLFGADATFDLSDHCDFDELMDVVELSGAQQVYTVHGYTEDFARSLRRKGIKAWALEASMYVTIMSAFQISGGLAAGAIGTSAANLAKLADQYLK